MNLIKFIQLLLVSKRQFVTYCIIGVAGVSIDFGIYCLLIMLLGIDYYQISNAAGYCVATIFSFTANSLMTFAVRDRLARRFTTFCIVAFIGWGASSILLALLLSFENFNVYSSKAAALIIIVLIQYNLNRHLTFRKSS